MRPEEGDPQSLGRSRGGRNTKIHLAASSLTQALDLCLSPGQAHDAPIGRELLKRLGSDNLQNPLMDRAYEGNETRYLMPSLGFEPVAPPPQTRHDPWSLDAELHKRRNETARRSGRIQAPPGGPSSTVNGYMLGWSCVCGAASRRDGLRTAAKP